MNIVFAAIRLEVRFELAGYRDSPLRGMSALGTTLKQSSR
jgi:hypothetical protein